MIFLLFAWGALIIYFRLLLINMTGTVDSLETFSATDPNITF
jgi:hypothetical protein